MEHLESRTLLTQAASGIHAALPSAPVSAAVQSPVGEKLGPHERPSLKTAESWRVQKPPIFYPPYTGPIQPDLAAIGAIARFTRGRGFGFKGHLLGSINTSQSLYYVFGVNRGGATEPGPFPGRPLINFDAEIIVQTSSDGFEGEVALLNSAGQTISTASLPNNAVQFVNDHFQVFVPLRDLPPTGPAGSAVSPTDYTYAFWAGVSASAPKGIASFYPQYNETSVLPSRVTTT
jgi:hypothetical protein